MAEATQLGRQRHFVLGNLRGVSAAGLTFAANGDTWTTPLHVIGAILLTPTTNTAYGFTVAGGTITLISAGALTFRGGVLGL